MDSIYAFVKEQRDNYRTRTVEITPGYEFSQYQTLRTIELYHGSKFTSGNKDSLGREKPFYNITKFRVNVAVRATDLDTKDVKIESERPGKEAYVQSFLLSLKNRNWMKTSNFAGFLNAMGQTRAKYGHVLVKKVEREGELELHVMRWRDMITDQLDITSGVKIERHYYTPAALKTEAPKNWKNLDEAIEAAKKSQKAEVANPAQKQNLTPGANIEVYEVHGVLPTCYLAGTSEKYPDDYGSDDEYERQMHVVVLDESDKEETQGVTLYAGIEDADPYKDLAYESVDGRGLGVGVVEDLFEAQVWTNYSVKQKKDMLDLASKMIFQTTDQNLDAKNVLTDLENGAILTTGPNSSIAQVNNVPANLPAFSELISEWNEQAQNVTSTYPAILGQSPGSGTAYRMIAALSNEASALFAYRRQQAEIFIGQIYRDWILPFLVSELKNTKELVANLEGEELDMISTALASAKSSKFAKDKILSGKVADAQGNITLPQDVQQVFAQTKQDAVNGGPRRGFTLPDDVMKDWEGSVSVITGSEQENTDQVLGALFNVFQTIAKFPQALQDPTMQRLFSQILEKSGVSPLIMGNGGGAPAQSAAPQMPTQGVPGAPGAALSPNRPVLSAQPSLH
jgi:hypothetical protein